MSSNGFFSFTGFTGFNDNNLYWNNSSAADDLFRASNNTGLDPYTAPQVVPNPDNLGFGFHTAAGPSTLPVVHPFPPYVSPREEGESISHVHSFVFACSPSVT